MRFVVGSIRAKLLWATVLVIVVVMTAVIARVEQHQRASIVEEVERRGEVLARNLAAISTGPLLLYSFTALEQNVARAAAETDVVYAIVIDAEGKVAADSRRPDRVGTAPESPVHEAVVKAEALLIQETVWRPTGEAIYDVAVPIRVERQKWGAVRVGISKRRMEAEIRRTRWELAALALAAILVGGCGAALVARRISGPIRQLAAGAVAISRGDLSQRIEPSTRDEVGHLAVAFNHMAGQLRAQRVALEEANAELRQRLEDVADLKSYTESILSSLTTGIVTVDLEGRIVTLNPAAELQTGFFAGEVVNRYCTEVFSHTPELGEVLMETLASRTGLGGITLTLRRRNGGTLPVEVTTVPLKGSDGKDLGIVVAFRDLSAVRELESQLRRSDRLAALGTMAAGLAHEIKNPLTSLVTFSRHLSRRFDDEQFRRKFESVVPRELERINAIVERLLELARPTRLAFALVRLPALLDRALELYANEIEAKGVRVVREYARDLLPLQADQEALYRVLVNLVANALEAMSGGGRLTVRLGWAESGEGRAVRGSARGRRVRVEIEDTGTGVAASDTDRVFNPFFTTKEGGTGLGLALTHKIVDDHGGSIHCRSVPGAGTTFTIVLPVTPDPSRTASAGQEDP